MRSAAMFMQKVKQRAAEDLLKNGLELETVSLTGLDQTNMEFFNPSNAFDAEGLTQLTEQIERRKKIRNDIEQDTMIQIRNKNLEAEKIAWSSTATAKRPGSSRSARSRSRRAAPSGAERASRERRRAGAAEARQEIEQMRIRSSAPSMRADASARRAGDRSRPISAAARGDRIHGQEQEDRSSLEIERRKALELAEQLRAIAIAEASKAQSEAQAEADAARARRSSAEEKVFRRARPRWPSGARRSS